MSKFLAGILTRAFSGPKPEYYKLLPMLCTNESNDFEPNLARDCAVTLAYLAQVIVPLSVIPSCLDAIEQIVDKSSSWKSKAAVLELLQVKSHPICLILFPLLEIIYQVIFVTCIFNNISI